MCQNRGELQLRKCGDQRCCDLGCVIHVLQCSQRQCKMELVLCSPYWNLGATETKMTAAVVDELTKRFGCHRDIVMMYVPQPYRIKRETEQTLIHPPSNLLKQLSEG
jgi:hypothetical protein